MGDSTAIPMFCVRCGVELGDDHWIADGVGRCCPKCIRPATPAPSPGSGWLTEEAVRCVVCPACAFTFDAFHTDEGGGYSCPQCAENAQRTAREQAEGEREEMMLEAMRQASELRDRLAAMRALVEEAFREGMLAASATNFHPYSPEESDYKREWERSDTAARLAHLRGEGA